MYQIVERCAVGDYKTINYSAFVGHYALCASNYYTEYVRYQTYLLVFTFGHLQARSFMCTHKYVFPLRSLESRARLYTDWMLIENLTQSSTVSRSKTLPRMAANRTQYESDITYIMHTAHTAHVGEFMKIT